MSSERKRRRKRFPANRKKRGGQDSSEGLRTATTEAGSRNRPGFGIDRTKYRTGDFKGRSAPRGSWEMVGWRKGDSTISPRSLGSED